MLYTNVDMYDLWHAMSCTYIDITYTFYIICQKHEQMAAVIVVEAGREREREIMPVVYMLYNAHIL